MASKSSIVQVPLALLSWYHHTTLLDKVKGKSTRNFYIQKAVENGWSRDVMVHQIESRLFERQGALTNNFEVALPAYDSELAIQLFKDPYQLDFIMLGEEARERDLEDALMNHITKLLLELGEARPCRSDRVLHLWAGKKGLKLVAKNFLLTCCFTTPNYGGIS